MARGRKPKEEKVVPLTEAGIELYILDERVRARLDDLRPRRWR
ncbi:hypothetical protein BXY66_1196 [Shimia isoporae]|uniref:Uncharacterized protein n=1 Tax=Shimia isoporae TaxID=647720 RepID=A0A4R1NN06_9RHOB|nr:hypothetical protein [Shimia isoporae]TCL09151.1 hypothetical protein BXY66_1196 [Shimia isoporae]